MKDTNEIHFTNDDALPEIRYTNDDIPVNEYGIPGLNPAAAEFGEDAPGRESSSGASVRFSSDYDIQKIASTFVVVSLVAMAVVLDDSPFGEFFDPIMGEIAEAFGVTGIDPGYAITCEVDLIPTDTDITYYVKFQEVPEGKKLLSVWEGSTLVQEIPLDISMTGTILNLTPGTTYVVTVYVDGVTAGAPHTVSTLGTYDGTPIVKLLSYQNNNLTDRDPSGDGGYLNFQITVIDRNGICSGFGASLVHESAAAGPDSTTMVFSDPVTDAQAILVKDSWIPANPTGPEKATLIITWDEGGTSKELVETIYI